MAKDAKGHGSDKRGGAMPIPGHDYHTKTNDQLRYIAKDASEAEQASRGLSAYNPNSGKREDTSGKYSDQLNNAASVLGYRARGGTDFSDKSAAAELAAGGGPKAVAAPVHEGASGRSIPIFDRSGALHGHVSKQATSIGASQAAGGPVEYANHPTHGWGWRKK